MRVFISKYLKKIYKAGLKNWKIILMISAAVLLALTGNNFYQNKINRSYSLYDALDYYGFADIQQKKALEELLRQASIISEHQSFQDKFPERKNYNELVADILEFVNKTQTNLTIRNKNQERWQIKSPKWMEKNKEKNIKLIKTLGFIDTVPPTNKVPDAICILGAIMPRMKGRINYVTSLINQGLKPKNLILLAGERYVTVGVDGNEEELASIARKYNIENIDKLTETHLIEAAYNNSSLSNKFPTYIIDTKAGDHTRPTTQSTIIELIKWLKLHKEIQTIVFVSNQPYVKYQQAIISEVFKTHNYLVSFQVIGNEKTNIDNIQPLIESIGTYIWAKTPNALLQFNQEISDPKLIKGFKALYTDQPFIYNN